nr:MFS transporter [Georgenia soli]
MVVFYLLMTTMALYAIHRFAASDSLAGLASSMFVIGALASRFTAAQLINSMGPRRILIGALFLFIAMSLACIIAVNLPLLLAVRLTHGIGFGLANTAVTTIAQSLIPQRRRGEGTGYFSLSVPFAAALGPLLGLALIERWGYAVLFWAAVAVSGAAFVASLLLPERPASRGLESRGPSWRRFVDPDALPVATVMVAIGVVNSAMITFAHPFTESAGLGAHAGAFFGVNALGVLTCRLFVGAVQDRFGDNWVMYPAVLFYAAGLAMLSQAHSVQELLLAALAIGLGFGTVMPTVQTAAVRLAQPPNVGLAVATFYLMLDLGAGMGPVVLGGLVTGWDFRVMYLALCGLIVATGGHYYIVHGRYAGKGRPLL